MGGLVVKKALLLGKNDEEYCDMVARVHGIMFLSTPHRGSSHAATLNSMLSVIGSSPKVYVAELNPSSTSIEDINEQFRVICSPWQLVSLYETQQTRLSPGLRRMIVDKGSGILGYPKEVSAPLDADHHTICKYRSRLDSNYLLVVDLLRQLTRGIGSHHSTIAPNVLHKQGTSHVEMLESILGVKGSIRRVLDYHLADALPGSCEWLRRDARFAEWIDTSGRSPHVLWLVGLPGTGKSTLAAKTIDHIQQTLHESNCQYHFFSESDPLKRDLSLCLRAIALQLAIAHPPLAGRLIKFHRDTNFSAAEQTFARVWDTIFENIIFPIDFGHSLHWVFDGLDEADQPHCLVRRLMFMQCRTTIKILFISRPQRNLTAILTTKIGAGSLIEVSAEQTRGDIEHYILTIARELFTSDQLSQQEVIKKILERAEGSFLWTKLALDTLRDNWHTLADIDIALGDVPNGMHGTYERMMEKVKSQSARPRELALRILTWVCCSYKPLTISQLSVALKPEFDGFLKLEESIEQVCDQFVRVNKGRVSLIHATAREFLLHASPQGSAAPIDQQSGHGRLAIWCLRFLSQDEWRHRFSACQQEHIFADRLEALYPEFPLLRYAISHWAYHVSNARTSYSDLIPALEAFCNKYILHWVHGLALSRRLDLVVTAVRHLSTWAGRRQLEPQVDVEGLCVTSIEQSTTESSILQGWMTDLIHIVAKFGSNLLRSPSSIYKNVPSLCPKGSVTSHTYGQGASWLLSVKGLTATGWDDRLAHITIGEDEILSTVRCAGRYFIALNSYNGVVYVWDKDTFQEIRGLQHGEWVMLLSTDNSGRLVATAGRHTFCVWELATGKLLYKVPKTNPSRTVSLAFAQADTKLLIGYDDCTLSLYDFENAKEELSFTVTFSEVPQLSCPRLMVLSPNQRKISIAFPGQPVALWDISQTQEGNPRPRLCVRRTNKDVEVHGGGMFNSAERIIWSPDGFIVYILYQDTTVLVWDLTEDDQIERNNTGAKEMAINSQGTLLVTSNNDGAIHLWSLPSIQWLYELRTDEFVRDISFSPDGQRIYDVRGSGCNVWAPDVLISPDVIGHETRCILDSSPSVDSTRQQQQQDAHIAALVCDEHEEFFCVGRDDGSINIHDLKDGAVVRKAYKHGNTSEVVAIEWSRSRRYIASADDSSKVVVKRLRVKEDGKWAVFPVFDLRVGDVVTQVLFNWDETLLLISTDSSVRVWDVKAKAETCRRRWESMAGHRWLNYPDTSARLIRLTAEGVCVHAWADLTNEKELEYEMPTIKDHNDDEKKGDTPDTPTSQTPSHSTLQTTPPQVPQEIITAVWQPTNAQYILYQTRSSHPTRDRGNAFYLLHINNEVFSRTKLSPLLSSRVRHILGFVQDQLAFIDCDSWICTVAVLHHHQLAVGEAVKQHFFLPSDWVHSSLTLQVISRRGVLLVARNGEVAVVRYMKGF